MSLAEAIDIELPKTLDEWIARDCAGENLFVINVK